MEIIITDNDRIKVYDDHFALMELQKSKREKGTYTWVEYRWFTSMRSCISFLTQKCLGAKKGALKPAEFLKEYNRIIPIAIGNEIENIIKL
ncbi:MAG TPA: hypothetical protein P5151_07090 [Bacteroidales bacterium]|nr:hypothetical protein [Bacteroidales bacterium]HQK71837.1 hypothetical protein [Bacteroidales bacterium]HRT47911.1 hypothetical protein [Bacteroidales bacterium]HRU57210.1 hypothetical protein [Bacteroidales bacterium]